MLFQKALEDAKITFYTEIGSSPKLSKDLVVGQVYKLAGRLAEEGEAYKATDALLKLAKIRGWVGYEPDTLYKTLSSLSQKGIDELRAQLSQPEEAEDESSGEPNDAVTPPERPN